MLRVHPQPNQATHSNSRATRRHGVLAAVGCLHAYTQLSWPSNMGAWQQTYTPLKANKTDTLLVWLATSYSTHAHVCNNQGPRCVGVDLARCYSGSGVPPTKTIHVHTQQPRHARLGQPSVTIL